MSSFEINSGDYQAIVRLQGGGLSSLKFKGRDLVDPYVDNELHRFRGDVLVPWPNRIRDGKYSFQSKNYTLPINESSRSNALHGLVLHSQWEVNSHSESEIELSTLLKASENYPSDLLVTTRYKLDLQGLAWSISACNKGENEAPYGVSIHPYLVAEPETKVDEGTLTLPSKEFMSVDKDRLLPLGIQEVTRDFDFNSGNKIGNSFIDHAFRIDRENRSQAIKVRGPSGCGVQMEYSADLKWIQIHTADRDGGKDSRTCLAVEPMTCPPDAFNSGLDLIILAKNQEHESRWLISAIQESDREI